MAKQQYVNVEFRLPVEVYSRLKEVYDDQTKAKLTDLGTAQHEMFEALEDMTGYTHVTIATFERRVKLWVGDDLQMFEVWEELEKIHGIKRAGRKFSFCGEEMDDCRVPGEFDMRKGALYIVPADFWDYVRLDSGVSDDEKMET